MSLKAFVNNPRDWEEFCEYLDNKIELNRKTLETAVDNLTIMRYQGRIAALRELKQMREELNAR